MIFISYRRSDAQSAAGRMYDLLLRDNGFRATELFMDVDSIAPGHDFVSVLEAQIGQSVMVLAVIGPGWLDARDARGRRRIDLPSDFVRIELESALRLGKRVVPVLVDGADMPREDALPIALRSLVRRHGVRLTHERFAADVQALAGVLRSGLRSRRPRAGGFFSTIMQWRSGPPQDETVLADPSAPAPRATEVPMSAPPPPSDEAPMATVASEPTEASPPPSTSPAPSDDVQAAVMKLSRPRAPPPPEDRDHAGANIFHRARRRRRDDEGSDHVRPNIVQLDRSQRPPPDQLLDLELRPVTGGVFQMGGSFNHREGPVHHARVSSFHMMSAPVTRRLYRQVLALDAAPGKGEETAPVTQVSWLDAVAFCNRLSMIWGLRTVYELSSDAEDGDVNSVKWRLDADGFRLPTEAEFEHGMRCGATSGYFWGDDEAEAPRFAWFGHVVSEPVSVASKLANPWGFYDLAGNVWEWCWDARGTQPPSRGAVVDKRVESLPEDFRIAERPRSNNAPWRAFRGGSYFDPVRSLRCANRDWTRARFGSTFLGFRCVRAG